MTAFTDTADDRATWTAERPLDVVPVADQAAPASEDAVPGVDIADQVIHLVRTWSSLKARMATTVDPEISSLFLIGRLVKDGPTRAKDLAEATCADQSTVSRQVAALVKAGLIERQADPDDGRASILVPTPAGVERVTQHFANRGRALEPLVSDWSPKEREQFVLLLRRFTTNLESRREEVVELMTKSHHQATAGIPAARSDFHTEHVHPHHSTERSN